MLRNLSIYRILTGLMIIMLLPSVTFSEDLEGDLQHSFEKCKIIAVTMEQKLGQGKSAVDEYADLLSMNETIEALHMLIQNAYDTRATSAAVMQSAKFSVRHQAMQSKYSDITGEYFSLIAAVKAANGTSYDAVINLIGFFERNRIKKKWPVYGALPYSHANLPAKLPLYEPVIVPEYSGGSMDETEGDLASSPSAPVSMEIAEFAESLNWNPVKIYEWVKNNVKTEWYYGVMKGAEETLRQKSGNDADQAALLVSLLRTSGFRSRFVKGVIRFFPDIDTLKNLTGIENNNELASFFQKAGIPYSPVVQGGQIANFEIEHIWVETRVPYANYRGAVVDEKGSLWVALDTSIKLAEAVVTSSGQTLPEGVDLDTARENYLSIKREESFLEYLKTIVDDYYTANNSDLKYDDLLKERSFSPEVLNILPANLQFEQVAVTGEYTKLPADLIHKIQFTATSVDGAVQYFDVLVDDYKISNQMLTLTHEPETVEDLELMNSYGGLDNTPAYLVRLRPVLRVNGTNIIVGSDGLPMGGSFLLTMKIIAPSGFEQISNICLAGNSVTIGVTAQQIAPPVILAEDKRDAARLQYESALRYIGRWNKAENDIASLLGVTPVKPYPTVVSIGGSIEVSEVFGEPHNYTWKGEFIDADFNIVEVIGSAEKSKQYMQLASLEGSVLEGQLFKDDYGVESISTAKLFGIVNEAGQSFVTLTEANIDTELLLLPYPDNIKEDLKNSTNSGYDVIIPRQTITYEQWTGTGYRVEKALTGESGWMLSGMIAGGMTAYSPEQWDEGYAALFTFQNSEPPNTDPEAGCKIFKLEASDQQYGIVGETLNKDFQVLVRDCFGKPVEKAVVTFSVMAGGGNFTGKSTGEDVEVFTNSVGVARVGYTLGKCTGTCDGLPYGNPTNRKLDSEDEYPTQVGVNIIGAKLKSAPDVFLKAPFVGYGKPGQPTVLQKHSYDSDGHVQFLEVDRLELKVIDQYGNPVANIPVNFKSTVYDDDSQPAAELRPVIGDGISHILYYGQNGDVATELTSNTGTGGFAYARLISGVEDNIKVTATVNKKVFSESITWYFINPYSAPIFDFNDENQEYPRALRILAPVNIPTALENNTPLDEVKINSAYKLEFEAYILVVDKVNEKPKIHIDYDFAELIHISDTAYNVDGERISGNSEEPEDAPLYTKNIVTFNIADYRTDILGIIQYDYNVGSIPSTHKLEIGTLDPRGTFDPEADHNDPYRNNKYRIYLHPRGISGWDGRPDNLEYFYGEIIDDYYTKRTIFGVGIQWLKVFGITGELAVVDQNTDNALVPIDDEGHSTCDLKINFRHRPQVPEENEVARAKILLYKDGELVDSIPTETTGTGNGTFAKGYKFDTESKYEVQVALNSGYKEYEILSEKLKIKIDDIRINSISIKDDEYPVALGGTAQARVDTEPAGSGVQWSMPNQEQEKAKGILATIDPATGLIKADKKSESGEVLVRVESTEIPCVYREALIFIGCLSCSDTGICSMAGGGVFNLSSIDASFTIGKANGGKSAGKLVLKSETFSNEIYSPSSLLFSSWEPSVEAVYDGIGDDKILRQVVAGKTFVDIVSEDGFSYEIRYYPPDARLEKVDGFYLIDNNASPFKIWRIENPDKSVGLINRLLITETVTGSERYEYIWNEEEKKWELSIGDGEKVISKTETTEPDPNNPEKEFRIETEIVKDKAGKTASATRTVYATYDWGESIVERVNDPDDANQRTIHDYYTIPEEEGSYSQLKLVINPDGSGVSYTYDENGRTITEVYTYLDNDTGRTITYDYTPVDPDDIGLVANTDTSVNTLDDRYTDSPRVVTETINDIIVSKFFSAYMFNDSDERIEIREQCLNGNSGYADPSNVRTVNTYYPSGTDNFQSGKLKSSVSQDGLLDTYVYEEGCFTCESGDISLKDEDRVTVTHGTVSSPDGVAFKTTRDISISDDDGDEIISATYIYTGSGYELISKTKKFYDDLGRPTEIHRPDGTITKEIWGCCVKESSEDATGILTSYNYDSLKRLESTTREGYKDDITTLYTYDADGRRLTQTTTAGNLSLGTSTTYDGLGRTKTSTDATGLVTTYDYDPSGLETTVTRPGGLTEITTRYKDGRTKSVTGNGVTPTYYSYGVNSDGSRWTQVNTGSENSLLWQKTTTDLLGRTQKTERPGGDGSTIVTENYYKDNGQLEKISTTGLADSWYYYDDLGNQIRSGLDLDGTEGLQISSKDRISDSESRLIKENNIWWQESVSNVYAEENSETPTETGKSRQQISGLDADNKLSETRSYDIYGNETVSTAKLYLEHKRIITTTDLPDSDIDAESVSEYGLVISSMDKNGLTRTYDYDGFGRRTTITDPRTGVSETVYDSKGRTDHVIDTATNKTSFTYDSVTGQKTVQENALNKKTRFKYDVMGRVTHTWGDNTYPVKYDYDAFGRMEQMTTFRTENSWNGENWPTSATTGDTTIWRYYPENGLLKEKEDASGKVVSYTYTPSGKLKTRTWARLSGGNSLDTTYLYYPETDELKDIQYSDGTHTITFEYDRLGRQKTIVDEAGLRSFAYHPDYLRLETEQLEGLVQKTIIRTYTTTGVIGRSTGFNTGADYGITYGFDTSGRFDLLNWNVSGKSETANYTYLQDSQLIETLTTGPGYSVIYEYEENRNLKTSVQNRFGTTLVSKYDYTYDEIGRRASVTNSGSAFTTDAINRYGYNDRNELTNSDRFEGSDITNLNIPVEPEVRTYDYDPIGNRNSAKEGIEDKIYSVNEVNQYTGIAGTDSPAYDDDGNMISASGNVFTYDAENRLISITPETPVDGNKKLEFVYDYMGRRVKKTTSNYSSGSWTIESEKLFVYDGWNLIQELDATETVQKAYVWSLDLSQSMQGAGGVGGLIATVDVSDDSMYLYNYDANGNVGQVVDGSGGVVASYEYDPFGNALVSEGDYADENPFRFSTKYLDSESGLYYYGYRYYSPELGRWINRDPLGEEFFFTSFIRNNSLNNIGELLNKRNGHPYLMVGNNPIQKIDYLGLLHIPSRCPKNTCDQWKLTIDTVGSVGAGKAAGLVIGAQLDADRGCCMDNYASSYKFAGGGIGIGLNISISVGGGARWISTECITWDDHVGFGRATTLGIGIIKTVGTLYVTTPQAYLNYSGVGTGFDLSAVTSVGRWFLNDDIQGR